MTLEMHTLEGTSFFDNIRRSVKISHFVASVIPLALLVYFSVKYVYPYVSDGDISNMPLNIGILLVLAVIVSVLGLVLSTKATNSSIGSAQDLNKKIHSLFNITKQFRETLYLDVLLENIMKSAMELTPADLGALLLFDDEGKLTVKVSSGGTAEIMKNRTIKAGEGIASWVAEKGRSALVNDAAEDKLFNHEFDGKTGYTTRSILCVPLVYSNETIGVIELRSKEVGTFTRQDEALINSLADQAGISIAQNSLNERQQSDFIHITEILVGAQDHIQNKKGHARRVANYANLIGKYLKLSEEELKNLYHASLLHDVGMLKIDPSDVLEKDINMHHPKLGYDAVKSISLWDASADIILYQHERFDGNGNLSDVKKEEIPLGSRVLFVADTFDILTNPYSYTRQVDFESALGEIKASSGKQFDPAVVKAFESALSEAGLINN